jgi:hypothetical protein
MWNNPATGPRYRRRRLLAWVLALGWACAGWQAASLAAPARPQCAVTRLAAVAVDRSAGVPIVTVEVNDQPARFVLDTGAERTMISPAAADRLALARDEWVATSTRGVSGFIERMRNANPRSITLGGLPLRHRSLARDSSLVVATVPRITPDAPVDGLLGRDFLSAFDLWLDLSARSLLLFDVKGCSGDFLPWAGPHAAVPIETPIASAMIIPVQVNGVRLRALFDTGASRSLIAAPGMARLDLSPAALTGPSQTAAGIGPLPVAVKEHRFRSLQVVPAISEPATLLVAPVRVLPFADMLLGSDWIGERAVWISFSTRQVFVSW